MPTDLTPGSYILSLGREQGTPLSTAFSLVARRGQIGLCLVRVEETSFSFPLRTKGNNISQSKGNGLNLGPKVDLNTTRPVHMPVILPQLRAEIKKSEPWFHNSFRVS